MPRELKQRGRRAEKQRKDADASNSRPAKRRKTTDTDENQQFRVSGDAGDDFISFGQDTNDFEQDDSGNTFYGLLTEEEAAYYANVNNKITANDFESESDRSMFIEAVYRESAGKEIKVASSQSCSRYLEKVIQLSTTRQLRSLFEAFLQDLNYLVQHRFGSHCCETLFMEAAKHVDPRSKNSKGDEKSLEELYLEATEALKPNIGYLLTERFASHTIRVLLLVLSGQPLEDSSAKEMIASHKKEHIELARATEEKSESLRKVPSSFKIALQDLVGSAVSAIDATYLRALATHPTGNPMLQMLLRLELSDNDSTKIVLPKLIPDQNFEPDSESSRFISSLVYDATGAYLVETLVRYLPGKAFKKMYRNLFRDRIGKLAKNEIASYVAISIFQRVGKDDLAHASEATLPELRGLIERNRLAVVRSLIERCALRGVELQNFALELRNIYGEDAALVLSTMLKKEHKAESTGDEKSGGEKLFVNIQGSLLAQSMLHNKDLCAIIQESLLAQSTNTLQEMSSNPTASRIIQAALTSKVSSAKFTRQFIPMFYEMVGGLALDTSGSYVVDALWTATDGSHFMKERIARILQENESKLRESQSGRNVWKNWSMDSFVRRPAEWHAIAKRTDQPFPTDEQDPKPKKTPIEMARERHMQQKARRGFSGKSSEVAASA